MHGELALDFFNNTGFGNHPDFNMLDIDANGAPANLDRLRNNIALGPAPLSNVADADLAFNSWDAPRQADGSLPLPPHARLAKNSAMIGKGVDVGLPFHGSAPDLGAFERRPASAGKMIGACRGTLRASRVARVRAA